MYYRMPKFLKKKNIKKIIKLIWFILTCLFKKSKDEDEEVDDEVDKQSDEGGIQDEYNNDEEKIEKITSV